MGKAWAKIGGYLSGLMSGLVPVGVAVVFGILCIPRPVPPEDVPAPVADAHALARTRAADRALATEPAPLPADVRALGSAIREFNSREAKQGIDRYVTPEAMNEARVALDRGLSAQSASGKALDDRLLALRATQLESFVTEVKAFERTGTESPELEAVGSFVRRMRDVGWCSAEGHACAFDEDALRVMFKLAWNALLHLEREPFAPTRDEQRALYAFYLREPHASEGTRKRIDEARAAARTERSCESLDEAERLAAEQWRLDKVRRIAQIDPEYPAAYAIGVALFRHKEYGAAAESFRDWVAAHPDGPWTLRARNYLKASLEAVSFD